MDLPPPPPYTNPNSVVSRPSSQGDNTRPMASSLPRSSTTPATSSASKACSPTLPHEKRSPSEKDTPKNASLQSSLSRTSSKVPFASASVSRSQASRSHLITSAEALLRSPVPRSVTSPAVMLTSASVSRSKTSQSGLGAIAEAMLRQPVPKSTSVSSPSLPSYTSSPSSSLPAYLTNESSVTSSTHDDNRTTTAVTHKRRHQSSSKSIPTVKPLLSIPSFSGGIDSPSQPSISAAESKRRVRQIQKAVGNASARKPTRNTKGMFKAICSTDLLFLMDTTGSMEEYIDEAKNQVKNIMTSIQQAFLGESIVRVAVVGYKDHCDSPNIEFLDFTRSMDQAQEFLGNFRAKGGEGWTADVLGGIKQATNASWEQHTRCIIHIADAPGHSRALHDMAEAKDKKYYKPGSEPHGLTYHGLIKLLVRLGINYTFLNIDPCTDRMLKAFSSIYGAAGADCQLLPANTYYEKTNADSRFGFGRSSKPSSRATNGNSPQLLFQELPMGIDVGSLQRLVLQSVTDSVTRASSRHSVAFNNKKINLGFTSPSSGSPSDHALLSVVGEEEENVNVYLEEVPPQWNAPGWLDKKWDLEGYCPEVVVYSESTLADMMASSENIKLSFAQLTVHARSTPFSKGAQRVASYARIAASASQFVVKSFIGAGRGLEDMIEDMQIQALCKAFALEFNGLVRPDQSLDFVVTACLQSKLDTAAGGERCILSLEPYLPGEYVKYNNNALYVKEDSPNDPFNRVAQAFSHFTFERSWGHFMVVDLQGVGNMLTDPVIHTLDPARFNLNDLNSSSEGFKFFFAKHECNPVCHQLGLVSNRSMASSGNWQFRQQWPAIEPTACCSNKFCQRIVRRTNAHESSKFPNYLWCDACWPQLQASMIRWICAAPNSDNHEFDVCRFFYESQGKMPPHKCPEHAEKDTTASNAATVVGGLWSRMKAESKKDSVFGNEY